MSSHAAPYRVNLSLSLPLMLPLAPPPPCVCLCSLVFCMFAPSTVPPRCVSTGPVRRWLCVLPRWQMNVNVVERERRSRIESRWRGERGVGP